MTTVRTSDHQRADVRPTWRSVAVPSEHGGWGLTAEPVLLGLLLVFSWPGVAIGAAATLSFLARTPLKLVLVDHRRGRDLDRTAVARRLASVELIAIATLGLFALAATGPRWLLPVGVAVPLFAVALWFDARSRGRRLVPELCGAVGMGSVAAAIVVAGGGAWTLAVASWLVLAARSSSAIPFVRTQIARLHRDSGPTRTSDRFQVVALLVAASASIVDPDVIAGSLTVAAIAGLHTWWVRRSPVPPAKVLGLRQMALGSLLVIITALGVHLS
jgi:YwiC-like protein